MPFKPGQSGNPSGRPKKSDAQRKAEEMLAALSPLAVAKLEELMNCDDPKIQATVALGIVKATIGELARLADPDGERLDSSPPLTNDERRALLTKQLVEEKTP